MLSPRLYQVSSTPLGYLSIVPGCLGLQVPFFLLIIVSKQCSTLSVPRRTGSVLSQDGVGGASQVSLPRACVQPFHVARAPRE